MCLQATDEELLGRKGVSTTLPWGLYLVNRPSRELILVWYLGFWMDIGEGMYRHEDQAGHPCCRGESIRMYTASRI